jgi:hypothetical protein
MIRGAERREKVLIRLFLNSLSVLIPDLSGLLKSFVLRKIPDALIEIASAVCDTKSNLRNLYNWQKVYLASNPWSGASDIDKPAAVSPGRFTDRR